MAIIRWLVGRLILLFNFIFSPSAPKMSAEDKAKLAEKTAHLSLYHLPTCPFCVKVQRAMKRQGLTLDLKSIKDPALKEELITHGGKRTVPCLKITSDDAPTKWLYESNDIIAYLAKYS